MSHPDIRAIWDFADPAASRVRFEALLVEHAGEADAAFRLELRTQIARAYGLAREFEAAHAVLDTVEAALGGEPPVVRVRYLLERGRAFNSAGRPEAARPLFLEAWDLARQASEHGLAVDAAHMAAIVESGEGSLAWNERAIAYAEETRDPRALDWLGSLYHNTGWSCHALARHERALALWERALAWQRERNPGAERERIARYTVGRGLRALGRCDEALGTQSALQRDIEAAGLPPDGYVHEEIGECLLALGRPREAAAAFARAHALLAGDAWLKEREPGRLERLARLAAP